MNKQGFTLIQTLLVLVILCTFILVIPKKMNHKSILKYEVEKVKEYIVYAKLQALYEKQSQTIYIKQHSVRINEIEYELDGVDCGMHTITFNARGNVDQARTIQCELEDRIGEIVINLGSGNVYVR